MAMNVFGNPITISTLQGMIGHEKKERKDISQLDKAKTALNMKNARGNDLNVFNYVLNIGLGLEIEPTTLCVIYNATGDNLTFVSYKDWGGGKLARTPFPFTIANGQWAGFVHSTSDGKSIHLSSKAAVVYRGKNGNGVKCDFTFSWDNPCERGDDDRKVNNKAFTEVREFSEEGGYYEGAETWSRVKDLLGKEGGQVHRCTSNECFSSVSIGNVRKGAFLEVIFTLKDAVV